MSTTCPRRADIRRQAEWRCFAFGAVLSFVLLVGLVLTGRYNPVQFFTSGIVVIILIKVFFLPHETEKLLSAYTRDRNGEVLHPMDQVRLVDDKGYVHAYGVIEYFKGDHVGITYIGSRTVVHESTVQYYLPNHVVYQPGQVGYADALAAREGAMRVDGEYLILLPGPFFHCPLWVIDLWRQVGTPRFWKAHAPYAQGAEVFITMVDDFDRDAWPVLKGEQYVALYLDTDGGLRWLLTQAVLDAGIIAQLEARYATAV